MARSLLAKHYKSPIFAHDPATMLRNGFLMGRALNLNALQWTQAEESPGFGTKESDHDQVFEAG